MIPLPPRHSAARCCRAVSVAFRAPVAGVIFLALLANGLNFLNISTYYQMIIKGVLLIAAVSVHRRKSPGL